MLDELPYGTFVEIEGEKAEEMQSTARQLGLKWGNMIRMGYHAIFDILAPKDGLDASQLSFENLKDVQIKLADLNINPAD